MTTGMMLRMTSPGFMTPMDEIPTPDLAVPYAAPMSDESHNSTEKEQSIGSIQYKLCSVIWTMPRLWTAW
jgi:hypothetical protein